MGGRHVAASGGAAILSTGRAAVRQSMGPSGQGVGRAPWRARHACHVTVPQGSVAVGAAVRVAGAGALRSAARECSESWSQSTPAGLDLSAYAYLLSVVGWPGLMACFLVPDWPGRVACFLVPDDCLCGMPTWTAGTIESPFVGGGRWWRQHLRPPCF